MLIQVDAKNKKSTLYKVGNVAGRTKIVHKEGSSSEVKQDVKCVI